MNREKIIVDNLRLVYFVASKFETAIEKDELISIGCIGLIKGVDSFKPDKGAKFSTYATRCIRNEILMSLRKVKKSEKDISLDSPISTDECGDEMFLSDILGTEKDEISDKFENEEQYMCLVRALDKLSSREQTIIRLRFGFTGRLYTQKEIANLLKLSQPQIHKIEKRSLERLRNVYIYLYNTAGRSERAIK